MTATAVKISIEDEKTVNYLLENRQVDLAKNIAKYVFLASLANTVTVVLLWFFLQEYTQLLGYAMLTLLPALGGWLFPSFQRRRQEKIGIYILLGSILLAAAAIPILIPDTILAVVIGYVLIVTLGNLLLEKANTTWIIIACTLAAIVDILTIHYWSSSFFTALDEGSSLAINVLVSAFALLVASQIVRQIINEQNVFYRQAQLANLEIQKRAAAEQEQREYLESTIAQYLEYLKKVASGNLSERVNLPEQNNTDNHPLVTLGRNLNTMTASLQRMIVQIKDAANNLSSAAAEILSATTQQATGTSEQSAAIAQTTTTVDEVKKIAEQATLRAQEVAEAAQRTVNISYAGQQAVKDTIDSMVHIKTRVEEIAENILALSERTQKINEITSTVNEIASQSNILALNASIEAARAGEHGKGFDVVALEVRNLAGQSRLATVQIKEILSEIQKATNATVMVTEEGAKGVDKGVLEVSTGQQAIEQLKTVIDESAQAAIQMLAGSKQQVAGIEQISVAMQNINQATIQNLASTRQAEKAAQNLNELANELAQTVDQYQL